jgi:hypothetical protein
MTSKQRETMLFNMDSQLHTALAAAGRACDNAKGSIERKCEDVVAVLKGTKPNGTH